MRYKIVHSTRYGYSAAVSHCHNSVYMAPRDTDRQICSYANVHIVPEACSFTEKIDQFQNRVLDFSIYKPHDYLEVVAESEVEIKPFDWQPMLDYSASCEAVKEKIFRSSSKDVLDSITYLPQTNLTSSNERVAEFSNSIFQNDKNYVAAVQELNQAIHHSFAYDTSPSDVFTTAAEVMEHKAGVCQDFAHLAVACLRYAGFPARYISGYLETLPPEGEEKLIGADASHAWFAAFLPDMGWLEFDPTNNMLASGQHLITAWGRDYSDVAPLSGVISGGGYSVDMEVSVDVRRCD